MARDEGLLADMVLFAQRAQRHARGMGAAEFAADEMAQDAVIRCLGAIGEAAGRMSEPMRAEYPGVPWAAIVGMRNRLVHEYGAIDADEVYRTVAEDLPALLDRLGPFPGREEDAG